MSSLKPNGNSTLPPAVQQAFSALATYDRGGSRAVLLPIDEAVAQSKSNDSARKELEKRLIEILNSAPQIARDYALTKLATIGSEASVPALIALLPNPKLATSARTALEAIPSEKASQALRDSLPKIDALAKAGAVISLGHRRDTASVRKLTALLRSDDSQVQSAAAAALGEIGTSKSAKALRAFLPKSPESLRPQLGDACLVCAERLFAESHPAEARELYSSLAAANLPPHILLAAKRGLGQCGPKAKT